MENHFPGTNIRPRPDTGSSVDRGLGRSNAAQSAAVILILLGAAFSLGVAIGAGLARPATDNVSPDNGR